MREVEREKGKSEGGREGERRMKEREGGKYIGREVHS